MEKLILLAFLLTTPLCSFSYQIDRRNDRIYLSDTSCIQVKEIAQSLAQWSKSEGSRKTCPIDSQKMRPDFGMCEFDITDCVPDHVAQYQDVTPKFQGPNCWNLALVMKSILPALRYSSPEEMAFYMKPPLCRQLSNKEPRLPGDVGAIENIYGRSPTESHGFIYISEKIAYSKDGFSNKRPYQLQGLENVYKIYGVPEKKECRSNELNTTECNSTAVSYYRCTSMEEYLKNHKDIPQKILESLKDINGFEHCLQAQVIKGSELSDQSKKNLLDVTKALAVYLDQQFQSNKTLGMKDDERNFILGSLQLRLDAISEQLGYSADDSLNANLSPLNDAVKQAAANFVSPTK